ncbi:uncharacterized protein LOC123549099 isoform X2 [Mercenaria mercenaria]|uniref:uncharacterized protein LOC123549099 isoform X2 n=1 Tax=Mercenaria mercenaria TaxID=6596 RepID=UPI00234F741B|nr:uncharacterized protein LOC123549099 isoform X2 [Mercenaria mercenaria]
MSVIIRLQGLSWSASAMDIRNFFKGLSIPPGGVRIIGGENGDAFIAFSTDEDARQAMMLTNKPLNDIPVQLFLSSKTEMQNTISQAKDKAPSVSAPAAPAVSTNLASTLLSQQIPSVQQISQAFPAVGQIMGSLGIQQSTQVDQFQSGFNRTVPQVNMSLSSGFLDNSNSNNQQQKIQSKEKSMNQYEQELPGEYAVGGIQGLNKQSDVKSNTQRQLGFGDHLGASYNKNQTDVVNQGFPNTQQNHGSLGPKGNFRGEVYFPQTDFHPPGSHNQPWENSNQQQNLNQNNPNMAFGNKQPFNNQPGNFQGHGKPIYGGQSVTSSQQFGHGKPFQSENTVMSNLQSFPGVRPNFPVNNRPGDPNLMPNKRQSDPNFPQSNRPDVHNYPPSNRPGDPNIPTSNKPSDSNFPPGNRQGDPNLPPSSRPGDPNFPFSKRSGDLSFPSDNKSNESSFLSSGHPTDFPNTQTTGIHFPQRSVPNDVSHLQGSRQSQLNIPPSSRSQTQNLPLVSRQDDSKFLATTLPFDLSFTQASMPNKSTLPPRPRQSASRFSPAIVSSEANNPPVSRISGTNFPQSSQPNDPYSTKSTYSTPGETANKIESGRLSMASKTNVPADKSSGGLILSNKRDEFGRNVPYTGREGNLSDSSRTPTQDEKYDDSRDSSDTRLRDSNRRSSRDRDRSRDRSSRRDSPRDRDRRDRDRGRRDRDDDRRSRRDRDKDRDRDKRPRERDSERYEKSRESKDKDRKTSPARDLNRKARKRSLSPSSKNKNENEKKLQIEKAGQSPVVKRDVTDNKVKSSVGNSSSDSKSVDKTSSLLEKDIEKKASTGAHPLFPVVPLPKSGRGLLGEAPVTLSENVNPGFGNFNPSTSLMSSLNGQKVTGIGGVNAGPLLNTPVEAVPKDFRGYEPSGGFPGPRADIPPSDMGIASQSGFQKRSVDGHSGKGVGEQSQTFEYGHSGGMVGQINRERPFDNRSDFRGSRFTRHAQLDTGMPSADYRELDRDIPHYDQPEFHNNQQHPRFNRGQGGRDGPPSFVDRNQRGFQSPDREGPFRQMGGPPFDDRRSEAFRGPTQGPGPDSTAPPFNERNTHIQGREGRRSLLGDGGMQRDFRGPGYDRFPDGPAFDEGMQRYESLPPDFRGQPQGQYETHGRHFNDRNTNESRVMPSLLDDIPFGNRREFQGRPGRDLPPRREGPQSDFRDEPSFERGRDKEDRKIFEHAGRNDHSFDRRSSGLRSRQGQEDFNGPADFRGHEMDDRHFNREQNESRDKRPPFDNRGREFGGPQGRDFDRMSGNIRGPNMGQQNNRDMHRDNESSYMQSDRDRDRRSFDRDGTSFERERGDFNRRDKYDNRFSGRYEDHADATRDRSNERGRDERNREQHGYKNERDRSTFRDDRKRDNDERRNRGDDNSNDKRSSANDKNELKVSSEKQSENKNEAKPSEKNVDLKENTLASEATKGSALCSVVLENIPVETTYKDIRKLFAGLELPKDGIKILNNNEGKRIGKAFVRFGSQESFKKGLQKDRTRLGNKIMVIKPVPRKEFDNAIDSYLPPDDDDDVAPDLDMCNSLSATLRALKGEPQLKMQKKSVTPNTKDFVVKISLLPEYAKVQHIKSYFEGFGIAKNGEAIVVESSRFKTCTGLGYVEFADESSFKRALNLKKMLDRKTIKLTHGSKKEMNDLMNKMKSETNSKVSDKSADGRKDEKTNTKSEHKEAKESGIESNQAKISDTVKTPKVSKESTVASTEPSKTPPVKLSPACTCLRVRNIPKTMKVFELRSLFEGVGVSVRVAQICHDAVGKAIGEGYVEFSTNSDVQKSLVKNETSVGKNKISVEPVTKTEMIENMRLLRQSLQPETPTTQAVFFFVKAANLPKNVSTGEIMNFFSGYNPAPESIRLNIGDGSEPPDCSTALVGFRTREQAETAIASTNGNLLRNKNVNLTKVIL